MEMEEKYAKIKEFEAEKKSQNELSKPELLEALFHSQTRAREAEKAAQKAINVKEDMISQFMKQASQLFAYKQWFRILQLEATRNSNVLAFFDFGYGVHHFWSGTEEEMYLKSTGSD
ncbi:unnamed protein product [Lactuca virosa]|uniref:Flotillin-like n=1 Tax=Lactuca virosa TaxID=75947 RepID=A0AAU9PUV1_9ASTR|nr:unnamed protein product [Lactuca virosa]